MSTGYGYIGRKDDYVKRLRRIEGQARGLQRMVEDEQYCIDLLTQVSAMTTALQSVALGLVEEHLSHCVVDADRTGGPEADAKVRRGSRRDQPPRPLLTGEGGAYLGLRGRQLGAGPSAQVGTCGDQVCRSSTARRRAG